MQSNLYTLKKHLGNSEYIDFSKNLILKKISTSKNLFLYLFEDDKPSGKNEIFQLNLPKESYNNLIELLNEFNLNDFVLDFLSFIYQSQNAFLLYNEEFNDTLSEDFLNEKKDLKKLLDTLEIYLSKKDNQLYSVSFKFYSLGSKNIKNFFVQDDIYQALINYYNLSEENFETRKKEILELFTNNFNFNKGGEFVKMRIVQTLFNFLKKYIKISDNYALRFCGVFLHICQIPTNKKHQDISIGNIEDALAIIEPQYLMHYKIGRLSYSI